MIKSSHSVKLLAKCRTQLRQRRTSASKQPQPVFSVTSSFEGLSILSVVEPNLPAGAHLWHHPASSVTSYISLATSLTACNYQ